jgi:RNA polymerase sigma-70 factor (ECF subfamily)
MNDSEIHGTLATLFRRQSGRLISALTRLLGVHRLDLAEDIVQESLLAALQAWKLGLPRDPAAWLFAVARNRARDVLRRERVRGSGELDDAVFDALEAEDRVDERDDLVRLMFSCCHPRISEDGQTALILRLVCGFGPREVAHAFLADPAAMEKRLVRAKRVLASEGLHDARTIEQIRDRRPAVLAAIYLMFDAGYHGSLSPHPLRAEMCADAIHLAGILADSRATAGAEVDALLALMCLHAARLPARADAEGALVPFEKQDRTRWDPALLGRGMRHLSASATGMEFTAYHLEAGIAAHHAVAKSLEETRWDEIVRLYDLLYECKHTPVVALNRAVARAQIFGAEAGIDELLAIEGREHLESYPFFWAALGDLGIRAGQPSRARAWLERGAGTARNDSERQVFRRRLEECGSLDLVRGDSHLL